SQNGYRSRLLAGPEHAQTLCRQHLHHFAGVLESDHQFGLQSFAAIQLSSMPAGAIKETVDPVGHYANFSFLAHLRFSRALPLPLETGSLAPHIRENLRQKSAP